MSSVAKKSKKSKKKKKGKKFKDSIVSINMKKPIRKSKADDINFDDDSSDDEDLLNLTKGLKQKTNIFKQFKKKDDFSIDMATVKKMMASGAMFGGEDELAGDMGMEKSSGPKKAKKKLRV